MVRSFLQKLKILNSNNTNSQPIFIIGAARSGTSILALAVRSAMKIPSFAEGHFLPVLNHVVSAIDKYYENKSSPLHAEIGAISHIKKDELINEIQNLFFNTYNALYQSDVWLDKTPEIEMINSIPIIAKTWPNAKFIFAKRRGIENINSRMKKWPNETFQSHCIRWSACMKSWVEVRNSVLDSCIEIEQREIENNPKMTSKRICDFLNIGKKSDEIIYDIFTSKRPESTSLSKSFDIENNNTSWTEQEIATWKNYCSDINRKYGYSENATYYL